MKPQNHARIRIAARQGFTLLELLVAMVVILTVVSLVMPRFGRIKQGTYEDAISSDLKNLVQQQELLFATEGRYADDPADPALRFTPSNKVNIVLVETVPDRAWLATGDYISWPEAQCAVAVGEFIPPGYTGNRVECVASTVSP